MKCKLIKSSNNINIIVDSKDFDFLNKWSWRINKSGYAVRTTTNKQISIHQQIMGNKDGFVIDHINRNKLDNRKSNLRFVTRSQNNLNRKIDPRNTTGYNGINICKTGSYRVRISNKDLGRHKTLEKAIEVRNKAVAEMMSFPMDYLVLPFQNGEKNP